eukprot:355029-Alexandrium_andersonii.AAC.1
MHLRRALPLGILRRAYAWTVHAHIQAAPIRARRTSIEEIRTLGTKCRSSIEVPGNSTKPWANTESTGR